MNSLLKIKDFFEKNDWIDKKSITMRFFIKKSLFDEKTVYENCKKIIEESGCSLRE